MDEKNREEFTNQEHNTEATPAPEKKKTWWKKLLGN